MSNSIEPGNYKYVDVPFSIKTCEFFNNAGSESVKIRIEIEKKSFILIVDDTGALYGNNPEFCAILDGYDGAPIDNETPSQDPIAFGKTQAEAVSNLIEQLYDRGKI